MFCSEMCVTGSIALRIRSVGCTSCVYVRVRQVVSCDDEHEYESMTQHRLTVASRAAPSPARHLPPQQISHSPAHAHLAHTHARLAHTRTHTRPIHTRAHMAKVRSLSLTLQKITTE